MAGNHEQSRHRRPIRSFVRRTGRLTLSQKRALDESWPTYGVNFSETMLDFTKTFGRDAPVILEIGFGNGESLVQQALENPGNDYLAIEVHKPGVGHCLIAARDAELSNLKLIAHDAIDVLQHQIPMNSLRRINLYFPDPWPKKRHHKRRIIQASFLELCADRLESGAALHIATDWRNYAEHIDETLDESPRFKCARRHEHDGDQPLDRPATKFERRGLKKGHRIWDWCFNKCD